MDNTKYLLEFNIPGCSSGFENFGSSTVRLKASHGVCFCCLSTNIPVVNASKCSHTELVKFFFKKRNAAELWICRICHYMLKKIELFRFQVHRSFHNLNKMVPQEDSNWKLVNDLTKENLNNISVTATVKTEIEDTMDPLEVPQEDSNWKLVNDLTEENMNNISVTATVKTEIEDTMDPLEVPQEDSNWKLVNDLTKENMNNISLTATVKTEIEDTMDPLEVPQEDSNWKLVNDLTKENINNISVTATVKTEIEDTMDPLEVTNTNEENEIVIKFEPEFDSDISSEPTNAFEESIQPYTHETNIQRNEPTNDTKQKETSQNLNLMNTMIQLTPIRPQKKNNSLLKTTLSTEVPQEDSYWKLVNELTKKNLSEISLMPIVKTKVKDTMDHLEVTNTNEQNEIEIKFEPEFDLDISSEPTNAFEESIQTYTHEDTHKHSDYESGPPTKKKLLTVNVARARKSLLKQQYKREPDVKVDIATENIRSADNKVVETSEMTKIIEKRQRSAEALRRWRERKKALVGYEKKQAKTGAQRNREYRERKKLEKKILLKQLSDQDFDVVRTSSSQVNQTAGPSTINNIPEELTTIENSQSNQHIGYVCDYCGLKTKYKVNMATHIEMEHLKTNRFWCRSCNKIFGSDQFLQRHINYAHKKRQLPKDKICQYCGKAFAILPELIGHLLTHTDERPLSCELCNKSIGNVPL